MQHWSVRHSKVKCKGVSYVCAAKYIAMTSSEEDKSLGGIRPGTNTTEMHMKKGEKKRGDEEKGEAEGGGKGEQIPVHRPAEAQLNKERGEASAGKECNQDFCNYCYTLKGNNYTQVCGGLIGLQLTGLVANIVMYYWGIW